jgi:glycosyltransferase involved in cell wall biosynthesis
MVFPRHCHMPVVQPAQHSTMVTQACADFVVDHYPAANRSLRIALVTETYPPEVNGVAVTLARVVEGLQDRNHDVQLVRPRQQSDAARQDDVRMHEVLMRGLPIPRYPHLRMGVPSKWALVKLWAVQRPDIVHVATEGPLGWSALQAARYLHLPVSSDFRTNFHAYSRHYGIGWLRKPIMAYLRRFHNSAGCTMVPTEALRRDLAKYGFQRLTVVARGVDTHLFSPQRRSDELRAQWGARQDDLVVTCVGRLAAEKNLALVVQAYEAIRSIQPSARLVFVGDGPMRSELMARCPGAHFARQRRGEDLARCYASADLFLFPSVTETYGNVVNEALASGLAVVAFDCAGAAQTIRTGESGWLVPEGDTHAFLAAACGVAGDRERMRALGLKARQVALGLDWEAIIDRLEGVLHTVMRSPLPVSAAAVTTAGPTAA